MPKFTVVPPSPPSPVEAVRLRVKKMPRPATMLQCNRCGGRLLIEAKSGVMSDGHKKSGGTKQLICAMCLSKGETVVVG